MPPLRILVTGSTGFLGGHVVAAVVAAGHIVLTTARRGGEVAVDLAAPGMVDAVVQALRPDLVIHLAAHSRLAECERDAERATKVNAMVPELFAERFGARLLHASTDLVFDGRSAPYSPADPVAPLSAYGLSKADGEERVCAHGGRVTRLPLLFGPDAQARGASASLRAALSRGERLPSFTNEYRTPLHVADAAKALVDLVVDPEGPRLLHLPGPERVSRWELARRIATLHGLPGEQLEPVECQDPLRPRDVSLCGDWQAGRSFAAMLADA